MENQPATRNRGHGTLQGRKKNKSSSQAQSPLFEATSELVEADRRSLPIAHSQLNPGILATARKGPGAKAVQSTPARFMCGSF